MVNYDKLRGALAEKRVTQGDVALKLGCSKQAVSNKIAGKSSLTVRDVTAICELLGATSDERDSIFFAECVK